MAYIPLDESEIYGTDERPSYINKNDKYDIIIYKDRETKE